MLPKPTITDISTIGYYTGRLTVGYGLLMAIPIFISFLMGEYAEGINFFISFLVAIITGYLLLLCCRASSDLSWMQGMVVVSFSWLVFMLLGAIPLILSGHFASYLDACFDCMSGLATVGFSVIQDLDHVSYILNMWRFIIPFVGGQGMVLIALTLLVKTSGVYGMYVGEGREDRILPNVVHTARIIWFFSLGYLCISTLTLWIIGMAEGLSSLDAFLHGLWLFMSSWDSAGFSPTSMSIIYYHSFAIEMVTATIFFLGTINFSVHYALFSGNRKEVYQNIEVITYITSFLVIFFIVVISLSQLGTYPNLTSLFRKAFYMTASAHTTTGHATIYPHQFLTEWGALAMLGLIMAMGIGGSSGSTAGGIKVLRIGILFKAMIQDVNQLALPKSAIIKEKFHHIKDILLEDRIVRAAMFIILCYLFIYGLGTFVAVCYGYPLLDALFESVSTGSGTGLSCGIVSAQMPVLLKIVYIFEMWAGRLEFFSVFALIGFIISGAKGIVGGR